MKKRKILIIIGTTILFCVCAVLFAVISKSRSGYKTNDDLLKGLSKAINNSDSQAIIKCFPDFIQGALPTLSEDTIKDFHNKIGDISFDVVHRNKMKSQDKEDEINSRYNCNIKLEKYALITCKYNDDFSETTFEMIKIDGRWYLYYYSRFPYPIQYFVE